MKNLLTCFTLALALLGAARAAETAPPAAPLRVVASFSILADMARQIGGDEVSVQSLVPAGGDAHVYQPNPQDVRKLARAELAIVNGLGFEGWLDRLITAAGYLGPRVVASQGASLIENEPHEHEDEGEGEPLHEHAHAHGPQDPHAWQDVANARHYARRIAEGLCAARPARCPVWREREQRYQQELAQLHADIRAAWQTVPQARRKVITSHAAFGYYARAYGVQFLAAQGVSTDSEPSAQNIAALIRQIRAENIRALFVDPLSSPRLIEQIARETGVRPAGALYSDTLSPPDGPAPTYIAMMRHNTQALIRAIQSR